jgi:hypothetical protein
MNAQSNGHEHEFEPEYGLPERLPSQEKIIWQGSPHASLVLREVFHVRALAVYFGLILVLRGAHQFGLNGSWAEALAAATWLAPLFVLALVLFWALAWLVAKTTVYTITDRRVVMRVGIVLSLTFNIPLSRLQSADVRRVHPQGAGEIALMLRPEDKIAYFHLWPHARPWRFGHPEPMLRCLPAVDGVAQLLRQAWDKVQAQPSASTPRAVVTDDKRAGFSDLEAA